MTTKTLIGKVSEICEAKMRKSPNTKRRALLGKDGNSYWLNEKDEINEVWNHGKVYKFQNESSVWFMCIIENEFNPKESIDIVLEIIKNNQDKFNEICKLIISLSQSDIIFNENGLYTWMYYELLIETNTLRQKYFNNNEKAINDEQFFEVTLYYFIYSNLNLKEGKSLNNYTLGELNSLIEKLNLWDNFKNIRALNEHGYDFKIKGISPIFYHFVMLMGAKDDSGKPLIDSEPW
jgi:hypothetical protein